MRSRRHAWRVAVYFPIDLTAVMSAARLAQTCHLFSFVLPDELGLVKDVPLHRCFYLFLGRTGLQCKHAIECVKGKDVAVFGRFILRRRTRTSVGILPGA